MDQVFCVGLFLKKACNDFGGLKDPQNSSLFNKFSLFLTCTPVEINMP